MAEIIACSTFTCTCVRVWLPQLHAAHLFSHDVSRTLQPNWPPCCSSDMFGHHVLSPPSCFPYLFAYLLNVTFVLGLPWLPQFKVSLASSSALPYFVQLYFPGFFLTSSALGNLVNHNACYLLSVTSTETWVSKEKHILFLLFIDVSQVSRTVPGLQ